MILKPRQAQPALQLRADAYMKILVANLGSTSFKYRLFDLHGETQLARGGIDRIGQSAGNCFVQIGDKREETQRTCADHAEAVRICLGQLTNSESGCLASVSEVAAIGFKAVFAGRLSGVRVVDEELLATMESLATVAPAHNPPYARAMRELRKAFPEIPLVADTSTPVISFFMMMLTAPVTASAP